MKEESNPQRGATGGLSRRGFLKGGALAAAGCMIVPRHVLGGVGFTPPSDKLNIAGIGVGGMGRSNLLNLTGQNIVALCDADWGFAGRSFARLDQDIERAKGRLAEVSDAEARRRVEQQMRAQQELKDHYARAKKHTDYRRMLDEQKDIDAVVIATPDHLHAVIAGTAMDLGKHVYVQKPLTWSVEEARFLQKKAADTKVTTQMGNQGHSSDDARWVNETIWDGAIGEVREVHVWTNRPVVYWPQGIPKPEKVENADQESWNLNGVMKRLAHAMASEPHPVPDGLDWDLFLGPSPFVPYHPVFHPFNWRGWTYWGVGAIGDMGAHLIDHPFWALDLGYPETVETLSTPYNRETYPLATTTYYEFPARGALPPVKLTWYDGGLLPARPEELEPGEQLNKGGGVLYIGSKGKLMHDTYGNNPRLLPKSKFEGYAPPQKLERVRTSHEMNWVEAAMGRTQASSPFSYAAPLTEVMLLGVVALNAGQKIHYDGRNMQITNLPDANRYLRREYREGWRLS